MVIVAADIHVDMARFAGKPMVAVPLADAIRKTPLGHRERPGRAGGERGSGGDRAGRSGSERREVPGRRHLLPHRHRPHLHGRRSPEEGGRGAGARRSRSRPRVRSARKTNSPPRRSRAPMPWSSPPMPMSTPRASPASGCTKPAPRRRSTTAHDGRSERRWRCPAPAGAGDMPASAAQTARSDGPHRPLQAPHDRRLLHAAARGRRWPDDRPRLRRRRHLRR